MNKFWNFARDSDGTRMLTLSGPISDETWLGDSVTPKAFRDELFSGNGDVTVTICSPGGDVFAAAEIYNALMDYTGSVTVRIDALAASAASVVAMAGERVLISPVGQIMIHMPSTIAIGDGEEMLRAKAMLDEITESIINAYELKTGLSRAKILHLMQSEAWMNARKAIDLGFADGLWLRDNAIYNDAEPAFMFSRATVMNSIIDRLPRAVKPPGNSEQSKPTGTPAETLTKRLFLLPH